MALNLDEQPFDEQGLNERRFEESWFYQASADFDRDAFLDKAESHHAFRVLRLKVGDKIVVSNGQGEAWWCTLGEESGSHTSLIPFEPIERVPRPQAEYLLPILKGRDVEDPVEALCQLSIRRIQLVLTHYCERFRGKDYTKLLERLSTKAITGLKQAKKQWLTEILPPIELEEWKQLNPETPLIICEAGLDRVPKTLRSNYSILSGPEGGISPQELKELNLRSNCYQIGLGPTRIRAIHAPLVACGKLMGLGLL